MKLNKYVYNYAKVLGHYNPDVNFSEFAKHLKGFQTDDLTKEELEKVCDIVKDGLKSNFLISIENYINNKYSGTKVLSELNRIAYEGEFEYSDNLRISDGSALDEVVYYVSKATGCCGFYDAKINVKGNEYKIGFNYGH